MYRGPNPPAGASVQLIEGVKVRPLKPIHDERGFLMEMLRPDWPEFERLFAEYGLPPQVPGGAWRSPVPVYDKRGPVRVAGIVDTKGPVD